MRQSRRSPHPQKSTSLPTVHSPSHQTDNKVDAYLPNPTLERYKSTFPSENRWYPHFLSPFEAPRSDLHPPNNIYSPANKSKPISTPMLLPTLFCPKTEIPKQNRHLPTRFSLVLYERCPSIKKREHPDNIDVYDSGSGPNHRKFLGTFSIHFAMCICPILTPPMAIVRRWAAHFP